MTSALIVLAVMSTMVAVAWIAASAHVQATQVTEAARLEAVRVERARADREAEDVVRELAEARLALFERRMAQLEQDVRAVESRAAMGGRR